MSIFFFLSTQITSTLNGTFRIFSSLFITRIFLWEGTHNIDERQQQQCTCIHRLGFTSAERVFDSDYFCYFASVSEPSHIRPRQKRVSFWPRVLLKAETHIFASVLMRIEVVCPINFLNKIFASISKPTHIRSRQKRVNFWPRELLEAKNHLLASVLMRTEAIYSPFLPRLEPRSYVMLTF